MIKSFILNLIRGLICFLPAGAVTFIVSAIVNGILGIVTSMFSPIVHFVASVILCAFLELCFMGIIAQSDLMYFDTAWWKGYPRAVGVYFGLIILCLAFIGTAIGLFYMFFDKINEFAQLTSYWKSGRVYAMLLGSFAGFTIGYFIMTAVHYSKETCTNCGRIFCISASLSGSSTSSQTQYKTTTTNKQIGSITSNGNKIADVYGNVQNGYIREKRTTVSRYNCNCRNCGNQSTRTEESSEYGSWE